LTDGARKDTQREKILMTALQCLSDKGYANTSMRNIANAAGVALSQLNYHFVSKEKLFLAVVDITAEKYLKEFRDYIFAGNGPLESIRRFSQYFRSSLEESPTMIKLLYDFMSIGLWNPIFGEKLNGLFKDIALIIEEAINGYGSKKPGYNAEAIARVLSGAMFGTAIQVVLDPTLKKLPTSIDCLGFLFE